MSNIITSINLGRATTTNESALRNTYIEAQVAAGTTNGALGEVPGGVATSGIRVWTTTEAAQAFVDWCNANYNPPPLSAVVLTV
jgi:hypothetical protein